MDTTTGRRHVLRQFGAATAGALAATAVVASPAHADGGGDIEHDLTGGWDTRRTDDDGNQTRGVWTFSTGGAVHYQDIFPLNALLHGSWGAGPRRTFSYEMWAGLLDPSTGTPLTARVTGSGKVPRGGTFSSRYVVTLFDGASGVEVFTYGGIAEATRIKP